MGFFEVGVAVVVPDDAAVGSGDRDDQVSSAVAGYDEAWGLKLSGSQAADRPPALVVMGAEVVKAATDAIAEQIGLAAERIAAAIEARTLSVSEPGKLGLESVEVSFGVTLGAGVQALFTAQAESSAQVSITLVRRPDASG
jgi:hypothetical protein